jgi:hypothetical protein
MRSIFTSIFTSTSDFYYEKFTSTSDISQVVDTVKYTPSYTHGKETAIFWVHRGLGEPARLRGGNKRVARLR